MRVEVWVQVRVRVGVGVRNGGKVASWLSKVTQLITSTGRVGNRVKVRVEAMVSEQWGSK